MAKNYYWTIILLFYSVSIGFAQPGNTNSSNTANIRIKVVANYTSQIGVRELTGKNDGKPVEMYLKYIGLGKGYAWCAAFVCWVFGQSAVINPRSGYCPDLFTSKYLIYKSNILNVSTPMQGDIFGLYFPEKKRIAHTGFIERWSPTVTSTVEGNTNQAGSREGDGVYRKIRLTRQIYAVSRFIK